MSYIVDHSYYCVVMKKLMAFRGFIGRFLWWHLTPVQGCQKCSDHCAVVELRISDCQKGRRSNQLLSAVKLWSRTGTTVQYISAELELLDKILLYPLILFQI